MMQARNLNLNGLDLRGDQPITPRTRNFLVQHGAQVEQNNGFLTLRGNMSISRQEVAAFLAGRGPSQGVPAEAPAPAPVPGAEEAGQQNMYFSYERYFEENPDVERACKATVLPKMIEFVRRHYNENGRREGRRLLGTDYSEESCCRYLEENPDVGNACKAEVLPKMREFAQRHYNEHGRVERRPFPGRDFSDFSAERYFTENPDVRNACSAMDPRGTREFALWHYMEHGEMEGRAYPAPRSPRIAP